MGTMDDGYTSEIREAMLRSMEQPAKKIIMRPLYTRRAMDTTPMLARRERRHRKWRRAYFNLRDDLGVYFWLIVALGLSCAFWVGLDLVERLFR